MKADTGLTSANVTMFQGSSAFPSTPELRVLLADPARLAALYRYNILDTPAEPAFDDIAKLAAHACGKPAGIINFIDAERMYFKAVTGIKGEFPVPPTHLAPCVFTLALRDLLVIPDLRREPRFACIPPVVKAGLCFYAGAPLIAENGEVLGTLSVVDLKPGDLSEAERGALVALARQVVNQLELRRSAANARRAAEDLRAGEERLRLATEATGLGTWDYELVSGRLTWSDMTRYLFGTPRDAEITLQTFVDCLHPDDRSRVLEAMNDAFRRDGPGQFEAEYRIVGLSTSIERWVSARAKAFFENGKAVRLIGTVVDITDRKRAEAERQRFVSLIETSPELIGIASLAGAPEYLNPAGLGALGLTANQVRDFHVLDFFMPEDRERVRTEIMPIVLSQGRWVGEINLRNALSGDPSPFLVDWFLVRDPNTGEPMSMCTVSRPLAQQKRTEAQLRQALARQIEASHALREETRLLEILNRTGQLVASELDLDRLVQMVTDAGCELSGAQFGAFFYSVIDDNGESFTLYALSGAPREAFANFPQPRNTSVFKPTFHGEGVVRSDDITKDPRYGKSAPYHGMPKGHLPVRSYLAVPVISRSGEVLGGLFFGHEKPGVFTGRIERVITGVAAQAAIAIDNARLYQAAQREIVQRTRIEEEVKHQLDLTRTITDNAASALFMMDRHGRTTFMNPAAEAMIGYRIDEIRDRPLHDVIHHVYPDGRPFPMSECLIDRSAESLVPVRGHEDVLVRRDGTLFPVLCNVAPLQRDGETVGAVLEIIDLTERKRAEERQALLIAELSHRVKNTLATVQTIAKQTLRRAGSTQEFRERFSARLMALSNTHDLLSQSNWEGVNLRDVLLKETAPYAGDNKRIVAEGEHVQLSPRASLVLGMTFHELVTNAAKYGALSKSAGRVLVTWEIAAHEGTHQLRLEWAEQGGPAVSAPQSRGFGSVLIERGVRHDLQGDISLDFDPKGVRCAMSIPLR